MFWACFDPEPEIGDVATASLGSSAKVEEWQGSFHQKAPSQDLKTHPASDYVEGSGRFQTCR